MGLLVPSKVLRVVSLGTAVARSVALSIVLLTAVHRFGLKPAVGVVDLVTRTAEGIRNTTTYWDDKGRQRVRPPRYFGAEGLLEVWRGVGLV